MRQALRRVVNVLDGQPSGMKGQSLVEMAFTFPLLILMVLSLVEVGFLANNYLILMDAVRAAGRTAVTLDPLAWTETDTVNESRNQNRMDCDTPEVKPEHVTIRVHSAPAPGGPEARGMTGSGPITPGRPGVITGPGRID